jgi:hypothetical protein
VPPKALDPARVVHEEGSETRRAAPGSAVNSPVPSAKGPEETARILLDLYLPGSDEPRVRARLAAFLSDDGPGSADPDQRVREAVHAILTMAEYQLA